MNDISPDMDVACATCGSDDGVCETVVVPVPCKTAAVPMCMSCRNALAEGRVEVSA